MWYLAGRAGDAGEFRSAFGGVWGGNPSLPPDSPVLHAKTTLLILSKRNSKASAIRNGSIRMSV